MKKYEKPVAEIVDFVPAESVMLSPGSENVEDWEDE